MDKNRKQVATGKKPRNPLWKRMPREVRDEWRKYLVIFLFLALTIGFVAGMYVANYSMLQAFEEGKENYKLEDGHFELRKQAEEDFLTAISLSEEVNLYEDFYKDTKEDFDDDGEAESRIRVFQAKEDINLACVMEGKLPEKANEIMIDRMHADNNDLKVGDQISIGGQKFSISGLLALVNYSTLYEHNTDTMFDALSFDVAWVTEEGFERIGVTTHYNYAWNYIAVPGGEREEKEWSDQFLSALITQTMTAGYTLEDYIPRYLNNAINFAPDDMGSDEAMGGVLLYILVGVLAFIFAIAIVTTITKEASVIGTLRALGYSKQEMVRHYMAMPVLVTLLAALLGNVLGYSMFKNVVVAMYYNSYSLPTYETVWYYEAFVKTTVVPVVMVLLINYIVIRKKLELSPLRFLRNDLKTTKRKKAMRLPRVKFIRRFRMRVMLQNLPNYIILFAGLFFVMLLLAFAFGLPSTLKNYQEHAVEQMFAKNQYVLKQTVDENGREISTSIAGAEKFGTKTLLTTSGIRVGEAVTAYGVERDSVYIRLGRVPTENEVFVSSSYAEKFRLKIGDEILLEEKYAEQDYAFEVAGIYDYLGAVAIFMDLEQFNTTFDLPVNSFNGYLSDEELTDIPSKYVAVTITEEDITKVSRQLDHSMGSYMDYFKVACMIFAAILIYLLTKVIIEHNEKAISMVKILGYEDKEIASLYLVTTTWAVLFFSLIGAYLGMKSIIILLYAIMKDMDGWLAPYLSPTSYIGMVALVFIAYLFIMLIDFQRIKRIPMDEALKNVE